MLFQGEYLNRSLPTPTWVSCFIRFITTSRGFVVPVVSTLSGNVAPELCEVRNYVPLGTA